MAALLFKLRNVPDDEAEEVRALLRAHGIEFYETNAGPWGISVAAIWLRDAEALAAARALLDAYEAERGRRVQEEYEALRRQGMHETVLSRMAHQPLRTLLYLAAVAVILYFTVMPFIRFA